MSTLICLCTDTVSSRVCVCVCVCVTCLPAALCFPPVDGSLGLRRTSMLRSSGATSMKMSLCLSMNSNVNRPLRYSTVSRCEEKQSAESLSSDGVVPNRKHLNQQSGLDSDSKAAFTPKQFRIFATLHLPDFTRLFVVYSRYSLHLLHSRLRGGGAYRRRGLSW